MAHLSKYDHVDIKPIHSRLMVKLCCPFCKYSGMMAGIYGAIQAEVWMLLCSAVKEEGAHSVEWQRVKGFSTKQLDFGSASGDFAA